MHRLLSILAFTLLCHAAFAQTVEMQPGMPEPSDTAGHTRIFLAGTIDNGDSADWQHALAERFGTMQGRYILYNPRRSDWKGTPDEFEFQVRWELDHLEKADIIIMNILGTSKSPVTLLEMGIHIRSGKLLVACEPDYYRYGNVRITCEKYGVPLYDSLDRLMEENFKQK